MIQFPMIANAPPWSHTALDAAARSSTSLSAPSGRAPSTTVPPWSWSCAASLRARPRCIWPRNSRSTTRCCSTDGTVSKAWPCKTATRPLCPTERLKPTSCIKMRGEKATGTLIRRIRPVAGPPSDADGAPFENDRPPGANLGGAVPTPGRSAMPLRLSRSHPPQQARKTAPVS